MPQSDKPATTESMIQWLLPRRMNANQQMRWAHLMPKVPTSVVNGAFNKDHATAQSDGRIAHFVEQRELPRFETVSLCT